MEERTDLPYVMVPLNYDKMIEADLQRRKGFFINDFLKRKKGELGNEKFEKERAELEKYAAKCWDLAQEGKEAFRKLEEQSERKIMNWEELEKPLRQWLENEAEGNDWGQDAVEQTIPSYRRDFERNQKRIRSQQSRIRDPDADFRQKLLNPATREAAIKRYIIDKRAWRHYLTVALNIIFEELEKRR